MNKYPYALILGANSDIGAALAENFYQKNHNLYLASRNAENLNERYIKLDSNRIKLLEFEATNYTKHLNWFNLLDPKPQVVICVFGYLGDQQLAEKEWGETSTIIESNYSGAIAILNVAAEYFKANKSGSIIGISSVAGDRGRKSNYIYGSAKAGFSVYLSGLRQSLFKHGVHVLTVKPGYIKTKMTKDMDLPDLLTLEPSQLASKIYTAFKTKKNVMYSSIVWWFIMFLIKLIPESIFKRLNL